MDDICQEAFEAMKNFTGSEILQRMKGSQSFLALSCGLAYADEICFSDFMAKFLLLFFLLSTPLLTAKASQEDSSMATEYGGSEVNVSGIVSSLAHKGYKLAS